MHFMDVPEDIILRILQSAELSDVICIRQACKHLNTITRNRKLWLVLLKKQKLQYPICNFSLKNVESPSAMEIEDVVKESHAIHHAWTIPRTTQPVKIHSGTCTLNLLQMFLDRWLLVVYGVGRVFLWDTYSRQPKLCATLVDDLDDGLWTYTIAEVAADGTKLVIASVRGARCEVIIVPLTRGASYTTFKIPIRPELGILKAINLTEGVLVFVFLNLINLVAIHPPESQRVVVLASPYSVEDRAPDMDDQVRISVTGSYMLILRSRSIEVHDIRVYIANSASRVTATPLTRFVFHISNSFDRARLCLLNKTPNNDGEVEFQILALDSASLNSLHHYQGHFQSDPPLLTITRISPPSSSETANLGGFMTSYSTGWNCRRGVSFEELRWPLTQTVRVWVNPHPPSEISIAETNLVHMLDEHSGGMVLSKITHTAMSESTGAIAWGNSAGEVYLLSVDV